MAIRHAGVRAPHRTGLFLLRYFLRSVTSDVLTLRGAASRLNFTSSRLKAGPGISSTVPVMPSLVFSEKT